MQGYISSSMNSSPNYFAAKLIACRAKSAQAQEACCHWMVR